MERPLRISAGFIVVGLVVELLTLFSARPTAFLAFAGIACLCLAAGVVFYLVTLLRWLIPRSGDGKGASMKALVTFAFLFLSGVASAQTETPAAYDITECRTCHADAMTVFDRTHHAKQKNSCAQCHGDVAAHARAELAGEGKGPILSLKTMPAAEVNQKCLSCHDRRRQANWHGGVHERRGLSCTSCHSVHTFKSDRAQLKTERVNESCFTCHQNIRAQGMRTSHHPVREGKLDCGSCHDPHDGTRPKMIRAASVNELCYSCHTEKRGPFLWEHAPVRENCMSCHNAHGSNHEKLLQAKMPYLCQRCHLNTRHPGSLYDLRNTVVGPNVSNRAVEHACRNCHQNIHGSNAPSGPYLGR